MRSTDDVINPIYVSQGHRTSLETSIEIVRTCCKVKIPEPVRVADLGSRRFIRKLLKNNK